MYENNRHGSYSSYGSYGSRKKHSGPLGVLAALGPIIYLPLVFVYLEVVFHLYMGLQMKYVLIPILFAISLGLVLSIIASVFPRTVNRILTYIFTIIGSVIFCVEMICKYVLQQYYQLLSTADTAANNKLSDYMDAILQGIGDNILGLVLMILPVIAIFVIGKKFFTYSKQNWAISLVVLVAAIIFHVFGVLSLHLPWTGDFTPKMVYYSDTNVDDQVEQLGIMTMLRLDVKHTLFGVSKELDDDFDDLNIPTDSPDGTQTPDGTQEPGETPTPDATDVPTNTVDTSPNVMDIDFDKIINGNKNKSVQWLSKYFQSLTPTNKNEYTGMFKDYNVIFITAEGFTKHLIDKERTPTLYKLANEGFVFNNYYTPLHYTSTSGGEFQNLTGLYPKNGNPISMKESGVQGTNLYFSLANQLNRLGYTSIGFHNNGEMYGRKKSHSNLGYDWNQGGDGFEMEKTSAGNTVWPQSDEYMVKTTIDRFINEDKFNVYYLTVSGHMPYNFNGDQMAMKNEDLVANLPYSETTKAYLAANQEVEKMLTYLVEQLEEAGKLDKTLIVMSPDHIPYFDVPTIEELAGQSFGGSEVKNLKESDVDFDLYKNQLIMWSGSMTEPVYVDKVCGQVDILPTVSNLLGLEYDSRMIIGSDILSTAPGLVVFSSNSWVTDKGLYNRYTGKFTLAEGVSMTEEEIKDYVSTMKKVVSRKLEASVSIIEEDYYDIVFGD